MVWLSMVAVTVSFRVRSQAVAADAASAFLLASASRRGVADFGFCADVG